MESSGFKVTIPQARKYIQMTQWSVHRNLTFCKCKRNVRAGLKWISSPLTQKNRICKHAFVVRKAQKHFFVLPFLKTKRCKLFFGVTTCLHTSSKPNKHFGAAFPPSHFQTGPCLNQPTEKKSVAIFALKLRNVDLVTRKRQNKNNLHPTFHQHGEEWGFNFHSGSAIFFFL